MEGGVAQSAIEINKKNATNGILAPPLLQYLRAAGSPTTLSYIQKGSAGDALERPRGRGGINILSWLISLMRRPVLGNPATKKGTDPSDWVCGVGSRDFGSKEVFA